MFGPLEPNHQKIDLNLLRMDGQTANSYEHVTCKLEPCLVYFPVGILTTQGMFRTWS